MASNATSSSLSLTTSQSLLSRISISSSQSSIADSQAGGSRKRRASEDEDENEHDNRRRRARFEPSIYPWMTKEHHYEVNVSRDKVIHDELCEFIDYIGPSDGERKARRLLVDCIENILKKRWPDVHVLVFGSNATGLELTGGDIDLVVSFDSTPNLSDSSRKSRLAAMGDLIRKSGLTKWINRIFGARVPIITFATTEELGEFSVDISIKNAEDSGARAIPLIKQYLDENPALRPLIMAIKAFLSLRDLNDASQNTLSSYAITLLCISFLQRNPARRPEHMLASPYDQKSLGTLLMDFFRHYGHDFSYATHYVSVSGKSIFTKKSKNWDLNNGSSAVLAVQCILNSDNNITKGCNKIALIVEAFKEALHSLQTAPIDTLSDERSSVLCDIFEVSEEDIMRRRSMEEAVESGTFASVTEACLSSAPSANLGSSGGVFLGPRGAHSRQNQRNVSNRANIGVAQAPRPTATPRNIGQSLGRNPNNVSMNNSPPQLQQLPVLRWEKDHNRFKRQQQPDARVPSNKHFNFNYQAQHYQDPRAQFFNAAAGPIVNPYNAGLGQPMNFGYQSSHVSDQSFPQKYQGGRARPHDYRQRR